MVSYSENLTLEKKIASDLRRQAPGPPGIDFACRNRLNKLRDRQEWTDNNNISPPPSPPTLPPGPGQAPLVSTTLKDYLEIYLVRKHKYQKEKKKKFRKELGNTSYESPDPPKLELGDGLLNSLGVEADDILEQKFVNQKQQEDAVLEKIKEEYNFDEIKDAFDEAAVRHQLDFFYGGENSNFNQVIKFLLSSNKNREFIAFLLSDQGQNLMKNNSLSIHIESGDIFHQNFNTDENFYNFILVQQDHQTAPVPKRISHHHSFGKYILNFLPSFSIEDVEKFDLYAHKNAKYL